MNIKRIVSRFSTTGMATLLAVGIALLAAPSHARAAACSTSITACGCTITSGTFSVPYVIANNLNFAPSTGACITISASFVILEASSKTISGPGAGTATVGVDVMPGTKLAVIEGVTVSGFGTGVQLDGKEAVVEGVTSSSNGKGFLVNGPSTFMESVIANTNLGAGFKLNSTAQATASWRARRMVTALASN